MPAPGIFVGVLLISASACSSQAQDVLVVGGFSGLGAATDVAEQKGFLADEGIVLEFDSVDSSEELMTKFIAGTYDLIQTNADNVIAWAEGQGKDGQKHDFVIIMGGYRGRQPMELVVAADVRTVADLRGQVLAIDAVTTGYALMLVYMPRQAGLVRKEDYDLQPAGIDQILRIRAVMGRMQSPLPSPEKFVEERFYRQAIGSLARQRRLV